MTKEEKLAFAIELIACRYRKQLAHEYDRIVDALDDVWEEQEGEKE